MATWVCKPVRLKSSSINSSETSAKYSWPSREQKLEIQDSGTPEEVDMVSLWWLSVPLSKGQRTPVARLRGRTAGARDKWIAISRRWEPSCYESSKRGVEARGVDGIAVKLP